MSHLMSEVSVEHEGFRLDRLEIYNWGTFNERIWTITPNGNTSLLTGANGSGKSTLVDAILRLLVPRSERHYNQASGAERRSERNLASYVYGYYGRQRDDNLQASTPQKLRIKGSYSVLLAVFSNIALKQCVSLAQLFWIGESLQAPVYVVAQRELSIATDFNLNGSDISTFKKHLKKENVNVYDEFSKYAKEFRRLFGLKEEALDLFGQIVSMKEIGDLNSFVRGHMLEAFDALQKIADLKANYVNLTESYNAIQRAQKQLEALRPLINEGERLKQHNAHIDELDYAIQALRFYFAEHKHSLLSRAIQESKQQLEQYSYQQLLLEGERDSLLEHQTALDVSIRGNEVGQQLAKLTREIEIAQQALHRKQGNYEKYAELVTWLDLDTQYGEQSFHDNRFNVETVLKPHYEIKRDELQNDRDIRVEEIKRLKSEIRERRDEIDSLKLRKSQIPRESLTLRTQIVDALKLEEEALPFVGELIKVRAEAQKQWEPAIERLLNGYARQLLVPDHYYEALSAYVDSNNLHQRLIYQRINETRMVRSENLQDENILPTKLEIKPGTAFSEWLTVEIADNYNYVCCESLSDFRNARRAVTPQGQIKHGGSRHEKDDRNRLGDRTKYVLGWDNRDKISALEREVQKFQKQLQLAEGNLELIESKRNDLVKQSRWVDALLNFSDFSELNWLTEQAHLDEYTRQQAILERGAGELQTLRLARDQAIAELKNKQTELDKTNQSIGAENDRLQRYLKQTSDCNVILSIPYAHDAKPFYKLIERALRNKDALTLDNAEDLHTEIRGEFERSKTSYSGARSKSVAQIVGMMTAFKKDFPAETDELVPVIEALDGFSAILRRIEHDDLPVHQARFKDLVENKISANYTIFENELNDHERQYRMRIDSINEALVGIDFTDSTFIKLVYRPTKDEDVRQFRQELKKVYEALGHTSEAGYLRIRELLDRFDQSPNWTRKVTDVRNWLDFSAEEYWRETGKSKQTYESSAGKSGGQKAKLAFTILASAIAYHYGLALEDNPHRTFRFVVIDEAFSKSDEPNSHYAMRLFRQLKLQLLVVTPLDKIHIVEPYIAACHFARNNQEENNSEVFNIGLEQFWELRSQYITKVQ